MIIIPTGRPSARPAGTVAGWPLTSNGAVFGLISKARETLQGTGDVGFARAGG
jgi:hypothetical protein